MLTCVKEVVVDRKWNENGHDPALPLEGIRVLDSRIIAGPNCTMQLADLGAEVIKIEIPGSGDDSRRMKPPEVGGEGHFYLAFNRNKNVAVDMKLPAGLDLIMRLAATCDVFVENFRPGVAKRLGVDYETLRGNFRVSFIVLSRHMDKEGMMSGRRIGSGFPSGNGIDVRFIGEADGGPIRHPLSIIDLFTSLYASTAVCAAIADQKTTGQGRHIDVSLMGARSPC